MKENNAIWASATHKARIQALESFIPYLNCGIDRAAESMMLAVKGWRGEAEEAGGKPLSGFDGKALERAFERLEWTTDTWCGILLTPVGAEPLNGDHLRRFIEILDPTVIVALDDAAYRALSEVLSEAFVGNISNEVSLRQNSIEVSPKQNPKTTDAQGRLLVSVNGFEAALNSLNLEADKQRVWWQLKQASRAEALKRLR